MASGYGFLKARPLVDGERGPENETGAKRWIPRPAVRLRLRGRVAGCDHRIGIAEREGANRKSCSIEFLKVRGRIMHPLLTIAVEAWYLMQERRRTRQVA